jgi:wyosine [tRNA(Phe)-imidazoG37] synthetase (radical SAM superfamily)
LGNSLGVDIIPAKTCTYNCVYCQIGRTLHTSSTRRKFVSVPTVLAEIKKAVASGKQIDHISFSGSGEPTLNRDLGTFITGVKRFTRIPVAVITNGSLLWRPEVRHDLRLADVVLPTLDFTTDRTLYRLHRPASGLTASQIIEGLRQFRQGYTGQIWLEVFMVRGVNTQRTELTRLKKVIAVIRPDRVHLNTAVRPGAEKTVVPLSRLEMELVRKFLGPPAEIIAEYSSRKKTGVRRISAPAILDMLKRRPLTVQDMADVLGGRTRAITKTVGALVEKKLVTRKTQGGRTYFMLSA